MATLLGLIVVALSVGLSNFAGAVAIGISGVDRRTRLRVGLAFGSFEALMPVIGLLIGRAASGVIGGYGRYLGGGLLVLTGAYTIWQGWGTAELPEGARPMSRRTLLITAVALSLDNLVVGFALGVYHVSIVLAALLIGSISVAMAMAGLELGDRVGAKVGAYSEELGGAVLVMIGLALGIGILR